MRCAVVAAVRRALDGDLSGELESTMSELCKAEADASSKRLRARASWYSSKLETQRVASALKLEQKAVEVAADCARNFDAKLKALAGNEGSVEAELMMRVEDQNAEIERLASCAAELEATREDRTRVEEELRTCAASLALLQEDVRICQGVMARTLKQDLDVDLPVVQEGSLRDNVQALVTAYSDASATALDRVNEAMAERDELRAQLSAVIEEQAHARREADDLRGELASAAELQAATGSELSEARSQLESSRDEIEAMHTELERQTAQGRVAESAREEAAAEAERLRRQVETIAAEASEAARAREEAANAALEAAQREAQQREEALNAELAALREAGSALEMRSASLETRAHEAEVRADSVECDLHRSEKALGQLRAEHQQLSTAAAAAAASSEEERERLEMRLAQAEAVAKDAEAAAEAKVVTILKSRADEANALRVQVTSLEAQLADLNTLRARVAEMAMLEAELRTTHEALESAREEAQRAKTALAQIRDARASGAAGEVWAEMEKAQQELERMTEIMAKSKADRAALVDYAIESLSSLASHLTHALAGLRIGDDRPLLNVTPMCPRPSPQGSPRPIKKTGRWGSRIRTEVRDKGQLLDDANADAARNKAERTVEIVRHHFAQSTVDRRHEREGALPPLSPHGATTRNSASSETVVDLIRERSPIMSPAPPEGSPVRMRGISFVV